MSKLVVITKEKQLDELIAHCKRTGYCSFDFETTSFNFYGPEEYPLIMGVSFQPGSSWIIPLGHKDSPFKDKYVKILRKFSKAVIENWDVIKVCWNLKFEYKWCLRYDIIPKGRLFDGMLAKYCLDEERPHGLKPFVDVFFPKYSGYDRDLKVSEAGDDAEVDWRNTDYKKLCKYCGIDSDLTLRGMVFMEPKLIRNGFYNLFRNLLMGIVKVLAESEYMGILLDREYLKKLIKEYEIKIRKADERLRNTPALLKYEQKFKRQHIKHLIKEVRLEIAQITKKDAPNAERLINFRENKIKGFFEGKFNKKEQYEGFNFESPAQLVKFLFKKKIGLRLKPIKFTKNKAGQYTDNPSTAEDVLKELQKKDKSGFMRNLLKFRTIVKLDSTYISGMYPHLDHHDRVHAQFKVNGTVTGRLSCIKPNLQNIPRDNTAADIKPMFIPPPGFVLVEFDYGQAELRIVAERAKDKALIEIFKKNYNVHVATACKMFKGKYEEVKSILKDDKHPKWLKWERQKKKAKSMNFSILYQQGDKSTAEQMGIAERKAKAFKKEWYRQFPQVAKWIEAQKKRAKRDGYVMNMFGRKRRLYNIDSERFGLRSEAERQAINAPIQGDSGDYTLFSQVVIREEILKGNLPHDMFHAYTVHDSIGYYIKPDKVHKVVPKVIKIMDNPETLKYFGFELKYVGMKASTEVGKNWAAIREYDPWLDYNKLLIPKIAI